MKTNLRAGYTLLELVVTAGIVGVLVGLLIPAVQSVRAAAVKAQSVNNLRQTSLAVHGVISTEGRLPGWKSLDYTTRDDNTPFTAAMPYIEAAAMEAYIRQGSGIRIACYTSPADPTFEGVRSGVIPPLTDGGGNCSYAANAVLFEGRHAFPAGVSDGTSNTIAFVERYAICGESGTMFRGDMASRFEVGFVSGDGPPTGTRRATFADRLFGDRVPVTRGSPPVTAGEMAVRPWSGTATNYPCNVLTFQVQPTKLLADHRVPQTPHPAMIVALADGSVRSINASVEPTTFWALVTPASGDIPGDW